MKMWLRSRFQDGENTMENKAVDGQSKNEADELIKRVAYHEAGHAVIAHYFEATIKVVSIEPHSESRSLGRVEQEWNWEKPHAGMSDDQLKNGVIRSIAFPLCTILSGLAAEYIHCGESKEMKVEVGSELDVKYGEDFLHETFGVLSSAPNANKEVKVPLDEIIDTTFKEMVELLKSKWLAVEALADVLIRKRTVSGKEAVEIIESTAAGKSRIKIQAWEGV